MALDAGRVEGHVSIDFDSAGVLEYEAARQKTEASAKKPIVGHIEIDYDSAGVREFQADMARARAERDVKKTIEVDVDRDGISAIDEMTMALGGAGGGGRGGLSSALSAASAGANAAVGRFGATGAAVAAATPYVVELVGGLVSLGAVLGSGAAGAGVLGASGVGGLGQAFIGLKAALGPAIDDLSNATAAQDAYNKAVQTYGKDSEQAAAAAEKLAEITAHMSPDAREAARAYGELGTEFQKLTGESRDSFFEVVNDGLATADDLLPRFAKNVNQAASQAQKGLSSIFEGISSERGERNLDSMFEGLNKSIDPALKSVGNIGQALGDVGRAGAKHLKPIINDFRDFTGRIADATGNTKDLNRFVGHVTDDFRKVIDLADSGGEALGNIFEGAVGPGREFVDFLDDGLDSFNEFASTPEGAESIERFFSNSAKTAEELTTAIVDVGSALTNMISDSRDPLANAENYFGTLADGFAEVSPQLDAIRDRIHLIEELKVEGNPFEGIADDAADAVKAIEAATDRIRRAGERTADFRAFEGLAKGGAISFDVDTSSAQRKIGSLFRDISDAGKGQQAVEILAESGSAEQAIRRLKALLRDLDGEKAEPKADLDTGDLESATRKSTAALRQLGNTKANATATLDEGDVLSGARAAASAINRIPTQHNSSATLDISDVLAGVSAAISAINSIPSRPSGGKAAGGYAFASGGATGFIGQENQRGGDTIGVLVGAGEAILNGFQQGIVNQALALGKDLGVVGYGSLPELFLGERRPHMMAPGSIGLDPERAQGGRDGTRSKKKPRKPRTPGGIPEAFPIPPDEPADKNKPTGLSDPDIQAFINGLAQIAPKEQGRTFIQQISDNYRARIERAETDSETTVQDAAATYIQGLPANLFRTTEASLPDAPGAVQAQINAIEAALTGIPRQVQSTAIGSVKPVLEVIGASLTELRDQYLDPARKFHDETLVPFKESGTYKKLQKRSQKTNKKGRQTAAATAARDALDLYEHRKGAAKSYIEGLKSIKENLIDEAFERALSYEEDLRNPDYVTQLLDESSVGSDFRDKLSDRLVLLQARLAGRSRLDALFSSSNLSFDEGGVVPGAPGAPQPILAHGGEGVISREDLAEIVAAMKGGGGTRVLVQYEQLGPIKSLAGVVVSDLASQPFRQSKREAIGL